MLAGKTAFDEFSETGNVILAGSFGPEALAPSTAPEAGLWYRFGRPIERLLSAQRLPKACLLVA